MRGVACQETLVELCFRSVAAPGLPEIALDRLARYTHETNPRLGLTGELAMVDGRFDVVLEGRAEVLLPLAARILADRRHGAIDIRRIGAIGARRFETWRTEGFGPDCHGPAAASSLQGEEPRQGRVRLVARGSV